VGTMPLPEITWQDVQQLPDDGNRYEAIEGELYVTPAPSLRHQTISTRLFLELARLLVDGGHGRVWFAPVGVWFPATDEGVQPDLIFVSNERRGILAPEGLRGAPDLVVEILSPTTASRDRGVKRTLYERQGVSEYWIVDHELEAVEVWRFDAEPRHERFVDRLPVRHAGEPIGEIDLTGVFAAD
jgi:Uma2 family endonuclease